MQRHDVVQQRALHQRARRAAVGLCRAGPGRGRLRCGVGRGQHIARVIRRRQVRKRFKMVRVLALVVRLVLRLPAATARCKADGDKWNTFQGMCTYSSTSPRAPRKPGAALAKSSTRPEQHDGLRVL